MSDTGWKCPGCGRCYAPTWMICEHCGPEGGSVRPKKPRPNLRPDSNSVTVKADPSQKTRLELARRRP